MKKLRARIFVLGAVCGGLFGAWVQACSNEVPGPRERKAPKAGSGADDRTAALNAVAQCRAASEAVKLRIKSCRDSGQDTSVNCILKNTSGAGSGK